MKYLKPLGFAFAIGVFIGHLVLVWVAYREIDLNGLTEYTPRIPGCDVKTEGTYSNDLSPKLPPPPP